MRLKKLGCGLAFWPLDWQWGRPKGLSPELQTGFGFYAGPFVIWFDWK